MRSPEIAAVIQPFETGSPDMRQCERRSDPRWPYAVTQLVAFHEEGQSPTKGMFRPVRCQDISLGGISFYLPNPPPLRYCTVILGRPPGLIFVRARVAHFEATGASLREWKIGCQFIEKVATAESPG
jgi:hypothetical protein